MSRESEEPDERFSFANERTFLAWNRTSLALIAGGLAVSQLLPEDSAEGARRVVGIALILFGGLIGVASYFRWQANERAMREGRPLPRSALPGALALGVAVGAIAASLLALLVD